MDTQKKKKKGLRIDSFLFLYIDKLPSENNTSTSPSSICQRAKPNGRGKNIFSHNILTGDENPLSGHTQMTL